MSKQEEAAGDKPYSPDRLTHLEEVRPSTVTPDDPWAAFWQHFLELWEAWTPADLKGRQKGA
ncbi:hypothetical protein [Streptomyces sp. NPDC050560]|uniref:hypothetical protein n=1 Tax=Streptomyces sp. NPDC050560 TaxID=3365630 RepID=UPI0037B63D2A